MARATKSIEIEGTPQDCYAVITDFENYPRFLDEVKRVRILETDGDGWKVSYTVQVVKKAQYTLQHKGVPGELLSWTLVEGFFESNSGQWTLEPLEGGERTLATYLIDLELSGSVSDKILQSLTEKALPKMLKAFKTRIENSSFR